MAGEHSARDGAIVIPVQPPGGILGAQCFALIDGYGGPHHLGAALMNLGQTTVLFRGRPARWRRAERRCSFPTANDRILTAGAGI